MAHVEDRWYREIVEDDKKFKVKTPRHGTGLRYRTRWIDPDGKERSASFKLKRDADNKLTEVEGDMLRGVYIDPRAGRVTLRKYAEDWLSSQTFDENTRQTVAARLRVDVLPYLGDRDLGALRPSHIQAWLRALQPTLKASTIHVAFGNLSTILAAAVDDDRIAKNPCKASSIALPKINPTKVMPWTYGQLSAVRDALPDRYQIMVSVGAAVGCRQGEILALAVDDVDFLGRVVHIRRQVKIIGSRLVFALPKNRKTRDVPLADSLALELSAHLSDWPAAGVTLPWERPDGRPETARLLVTTRDGRPANANNLNKHVWKPALRRAGVAATRENGMHALRHWFASALLDDGQSIKVVSELLGHTNEAFTLRTYTHLMPDSRDRARGSIDAALQRTRGADGPKTAQAGTG